MFRPSALAVAALLIVAGAGSAAGQDTLTNGGDAAGSIGSPGQKQTWTFTASQGDGLVLSVIDTAADPAWAPSATVMAPNGTSLGTFGGPDVGQARLAATQTGTYSVVVGANPNVPNGTGPYVLRLAKAPGSYTVPSGDQGGDLTNGQDHTGTITLGDLDLWSFHAEAGDAVLMTVADQASSLGPYIQIWGPNGASLASGDLGSATQVGFGPAQLSGTYTVLISANVNAPASMGNYILRLARAPAAFVVPTFDEGGDLTNGQNHTGTITQGDLDLWRFAADAGAAVSLTLTAPTTGLEIRVVGTNGAVLAAAASGLVTQVNLTAPLSGVYTVVISAYINAPASTSTYTLLATGIQNPPPQPPLLNEKSLGGGSCPHLAEVPESDNASCEGAGEKSSVCGMSDGASTTGDTWVGNPCNVATGNKFQYVTDYQTAGPNVLRFTRYYNALAGASSTSFGRNWRHSFERRLRLNSPTSVSAERANGRVLSFTLTNGAWKSDTDVDLTLTQAGSAWTLVDSGDASETYTTNNGGTAAILTAITARNGYRQSLVYDTTGSLIRVTDSYSRSIDFTYNNGLLETLTSPDGLVATYSYGASMGSTLDRLASVRYGTATRTYLYENATFPFALTGIIDENGQRFATWSYDAQGRALSSEHAGGVERVEIAYNDADGTRTVRNALGLQTVYHFTTLQGISKVTQIDRLATNSTGAATRTFTYDANGYLASATDWKGTLTNYVNDARGLATTIIEADGTPQARTTTIAYDARFHVPVTIAQSGLTTAFTYDADGNLLTRTETDTTTSTTPYATGGTKRTWTYSWSNGLLASVQGPRTDVAAITRFTYVSGALSTVTDALGHVTQITNHTSGGRPVTVIDPNGVTTQLTYDARQRLLTSTVDTAGGALTTRYTYDSAGNVTSVIRPDGSGLNNRYDAAHRLIGISSLLGEQVAYTLDALGDTTQVQLLDPSGTVRRTQADTFDAVGRLLQDSGGAGQLTRYTRDANGNTVSVTDPLGRATQRAFDQLNRPVRVTDAAGGSTASVYDAWDRPLSITAPNGAVTTYVYDGFGNLLQTRSPDSGTTVYRYDLAGNLTRKDDAAGVAVLYSYDAVDRILKVDYPKTTEDVAYRYDETGHGFGIGRLTSVDDATGHLTRTYDERGNVLGEVRDVNRKATLRTTYRYDAADRVVELGYPSGAGALYTRDVMGRVTDITLRQPGQPDRPVVTGVSYQPFGPVRALTYGNGIAETSSFDLDYHLTTLSGTGLNPVQQLAYAYDAADNVLAILDGTQPAKNQSFAYDALDRLTAATGAYGSEAWTYDPSGNRLAQQAGATLTSYTYAAQSNRLIGIQSGAASQNISYTPTGNIAAFTSTSTARAKKNAGTALTYNLAGRLSSVLTDGQQIQANTYDAFGQRLLRTGKTTGTSVFQYDLAGHLLEDADGQGRARIDYIYLGDRPIATLTALSNTLAFVHDDRLGTPQLATDSSQTVVWKTSYEPFGAATLEASVVGQNLRFPGQEYDWDTGWHHNGFRDYVPSLGRYVEPDPQGLRADLNLYAYAFANPIRFVDFWGLDASEDDSPQTEGGQSRVLEVLNWCRSVMTKRRPLLGSGGVEILDLYASDPRNFTNSAIAVEHGFRKREEYGLTLDELSNQLSGAPPPTSSARVVPLPKLKPAVPGKGAVDTGSRPTVPPEGYYRPHDRPWGWGDSGCVGDFCGR